MVCVCVSEKERSVYILCVRVYESEFTLASLAKFPSHNPSPLLNFTEV